MERTTGLSYEDLLEMFPEEDNLRRELLGGELFVTPAPTTRHQDVVGELAYRLRTFEKEHGGKALTAPLDVYFAESDVVEPDVLFVRADHLDRIEERFVRSAPDVVVEVSSPSTRAIDLGRKRALYERHGVPEYWFVDLEQELIEVHELEGGRYAPARVLRRGDVLESRTLRGLSVPVEEILGGS